MARGREGSQQVRRSGNLAGIAEPIERFGEIKSSFKRRQTLIRALIAAGLPTPDALSGAIVEAMWKAGFFRLRGVLVGTLAFQTYAGPLGVNLGSRPLMTQDADFAQFWGISENIGESIAEPLTILRGVDPTFRAIPHLKDPNVSTRYRNRMDYAVDFLTPNRGSADHQGKPARMKALGGAGAEPLRHLDFLLHQTERSVLLYGGGVPVTVPRAERYAVHKLIVAVERVEQAKAPKDILQAHMLTRPSPCVGPPNSRRPGRRPGRAEISGAGNSTPGVGACRSNRRKHSMGWEPSSERPGVGHANRRRRRIPSLQPGLPAVGEGGVPRDGHIPVTAGCV